MLGTFFRTHIGEPPPHGGTAEVLAQMTRAKGAGLLGLPATPQPPTSFSMAERAGVGPPEIEILFRHDLRIETGVLQLLLALFEARYDVGVGEEYAFPHD